MDLCHPKNSELEPKYQKYKRRVVLRDDTVKDGSGSNPVFTEQGSSTSQMTVEKNKLMSLQDDQIVQDKQPTQYPLTPK